MDNRNNPFEEKTNETQHTDLEKSQHDLIEDTEESTYKTEESPEGKPSDGETNAKDKKGSELKEWIKTIVIAVLIALFIRTFIFEVIQVDGISMNPTLENRDRIIVAKIHYLFGQPERGDIVIFKNPDNPRDHFVKRTIAVAGDVVEIRDGVVYVNDVPLDEPYINDKSLKDYPKVKVPENTLFVLGDNRNRSRDSTDPSVGFIPIKNVLGEAKFRIWPLNNITYL